MSITTALARHFRAILGGWNFNNFGVPDDRDDYAGTGAESRSQQSLSRYDDRVYDAAEKKYRQR
jgi:hypothetical protein